MAGDLDGVGTFKKINEMLMVFFSSVARRFLRIPFIKKIQIKLGNIHFLMGRGRGQWFLGVAI